MQAWQSSSPALVAVHNKQVTGFLGTITDQAVTTYIAALLAAKERRVQGVGGALLEAGHGLAPSTRLDLLPIGQAGSFYEANGYRHFPGFRKSYQYV